MDYAKEALRLHYEWKGKLEHPPRQCRRKESLSLAYTPASHSPAWKSERCQQKL